ncbi:MAG TPA: YceI family protein [Terriglobales bacterium]|nr:YceI family protein [Terriglobales bacterium]
MPGTSGLRQDADASQKNANGIPYLINAMASRLTVHVFAKGLLSAFGHNPTIAIRDFKGQAQVNLEKLEESTCSLSIRASSLAVTDDVSEKDRREMEKQMFDEVLEVSSYPEITYQCSGISANQTGGGQYQVELNGELTLHGITQNQRVPARVSLNGETLTTFGEFVLNQSDFGIKQVSAIGGALKVKDELKCSFHIVAQKQG